jgi:glycerol-3-phosphate acyltransferase PlsY
MQILIYLVVVGLIGYLCGAIPFGYLYVRARKGIDIRDVGSGRTGGTNALRAAGLGVGLLTSFSDVFKGSLAVLITHFLFSNALNDAWLPWAAVTAGVMSVIGHNWSVFMGWRGGAGTGPNVGWGTALWWPMLPIAIVTMSGMLLGIGIASLASIMMAAIIPAAFIVLYFIGAPGFDGTLAYIIGGFVAAAIILWSLRPNIKRLMSGTERVVGPRAKRMKKAEKVSQVQMTGDK